eukprot:GHRR01006074.1.p1 GENE.GHRR01006074.1~~GHRR01006074.1.p1  ORF type:complete len:220 (+),score=31.96 GHRR01006074.1:184-843(+)
MRTLAASTTATAPCRAAQAVSTTLCMRSPQVLFTAARGRRCSPLLADAGSNLISRRHYASLTGSRRLAVTVRAAEEQNGSTFDYEEPETAREAIDLGLVLCKQQKWSRALQVFENGLTLPGTGVKRFRDKPRLISDSEKMAALYNIACCHSRLQDARSGLVALSGCLETGYTDFYQIRTDPDLEFLRQDSRFEGLMERFAKKGNGFLGLDLGNLFGGKS